jgi:H3 lysine-79-specific histone-lysine N-methyltransferase
VVEKKKRKRSDEASSSTSKSGVKKDVGKEERENRELWCLDKVDERGEWGRGWTGFVSCEEAVRGDVNGWAGGKGVAKGNSLDKYIPCE